MKHEHVTNPCPVNERSDVETEALTSDKLENDERDEEPDGENMIRK